MNLCFEDFFPVSAPERTKVKFNIPLQSRSVSFGRPLDFLQKGEQDRDWLRLNAFKQRHPNHNLNHADFLLAFAQYYPYGADYFMFGGFYKVETLYPELFDRVGYKLTLLPDFENLRKRLILKLSKPLGSSLYTRFYQNVQESLSPEIYELKPQSKVPSFPGYQNVSLTYEELFDIVKEQNPQWKTALSSVKAVYCITDKLTGNLYIGSAANADGGVWTRWCRYADPNNLTGGNQFFEQLKQEGRERITDHFLYTLLEVFDIRTSKETVFKREEYWKKVFQSVEHGMNLWN